MAHPLAPLWASRGAVLECPEGAREAVGVGHGCLTIRRNAEPGGDSFALNDTVFRTPSNGQVHQTLASRGYHLDSFTSWVAGLCDIPWTVAASLMPDRRLTVARWRLAISGTWNETAARVSPALDRHRSERWYAQGFRVLYAHP